MATTETNAPTLHADKSAQLRAIIPPARSGRWSGYWHLLWVRLLELKREPEVVFWVFVFPLLLAAGLGVAFRNKPADITSVVVIDGPAAQRTLAMLQGSASYSVGKSAADDKTSSVRASVLDRDAALKAFHFGKYDLAIEANADGSYTYYYDPARPESVLSRSEIDAKLQSAAGRKDVLITSAKASSEPGSRYIDFLIPGLLGMNLMNSGMWGVGFAIVEMRQRKLLKRFVATPMRRSDFLLALTSSRLVLMVIEVGLLLGFGVLVFHMRVQGSIFSVILLAAIGAVAFGGVGLLTACRAQKIESVSGLINLVMMPMWIFSGVFFSYQKFPAIAQPFIKALPLTALNDALRATIIEGASFGSQSARLMVLAVWGGLSFILALRWFRWT
ncbi:MAG TPA: ABC transporter permease [Terriglobales bacterium]|jgi:ABC-2 type transport system permease protein|nr:ABC transporter permease [Terriglobales bacterium]